MWWKLNRVALGWLRLGYVTVALLAAPLSVAAEIKARDIILIHGAWVGEWYWDDLVKDLTAAGHHAHAVSLKGHGKRSAEGGKAVTVQDHADDIVQISTDLGMQNVILVGHSYGGRPLTAAWDQMRGKVSHVVYVESVAPVNDDLLAIPADHRSLNFMRKNYPALVEQGMIPVPHALKQSYSQVLAPQSMNSVYGEVALRNGILPRTPGTYVVAKDSRATIFRSYADHLGKTRVWSVIEISGGHSLIGPGMKDLLTVLLTISESP